MKLWFFLSFLISCSHEVKQRATLPEASPKELTEIDLNFYKHKSKNYRPLVLVEEPEENLDEQNLVTLLNELKTQEEINFFNLGKPAPPPARFFILPLKGRISSYYGMRKGRMHHGIDIPSLSGTKLKASNHGKVVYSGYQKGYGQVVILSHLPNIFTIYAHNSKNLVRSGQIVKKAEVIALMGNTGRSTGAHVHFEIRRGTQSLDPIKFLKDQYK